MSFKLKVSVPDPNKSSVVEAPLVQKKETPQHQLFEKAPEDLFGYKSAVMEQPPKAPEESKVEPLTASQNGAKSTQNIKAKMEELRGKMEQVKADRERVEQEIREVQAKSLASGGGAAEDYSWQQGEPVKGYGLPVVIVVAILSFIVGRFIMNV